MVAFKALAILMAAATCATAQFLPNCTKANTAFCEVPADGVSTSNIIFRCATSNGTAQAGNCNDNLAGVPPVGVKAFAPCWESSPTAGDAQCVFNCVSVKAPNGTEIYPVGCNKTHTSTTSTTTSTTIIHTTSMKSTKSDKLTTTSMSSPTTNSHATTSVPTGPGPVSTATATTTLPTSAGTSTTGAPVASGAAVAIIADAWPVVALMGGVLMF